MQNWKWRADAAFAQWGRIIVRFRFWVIGFCLLTIGVLASQLSNLYFDASNEAFFKEDDPILVNYNEFRDQFGRDDLILVAIDTPEIFETTTLQNLAALQNDLEREVPHIREVNSLLTVRATRGVTDELIVGDLIEEIPTDPEQLQQLREYVLNSPTYPNWIISADGRVTTITLELNPYVLPEVQGEEDLLAGFSEGEDLLDSGGEEMQPVTSVEENQAIAAIREVMTRYQSSEFRLFLSGGPVYGSAIQDSMQSNLPVFSGISTGIMILLLAVLFRRISGVLLPLIIVVLSLISTLSLMGAFGRPFTVINQILPSFILAVGVADAIHLLTIFYRNQTAGSSRQESVSHALEHSGLAIVMTSFTTAGGLWSFANAKSAPIADLGIYGGIGVLAAMLLSLTLLPALLALLPEPQKGSAQNTLQSNSPSLIDRILGGLGETAIQHPVHVVAGCGVVVVAMLLGLLRLEPSNWPLRWFPPESEFRQHTELIDQRMGGSSNLEVLLDTQTPGGLYEPEFMQKLDRLNQVVNTEMAFPGGETVGKSQSVLDILKESNRALNENRAEYYTVPNSRELIAQELFLFSNSGADDLAKLVDVSFRLARLSLYIPNLDAIDSEVFARELENRLEAIFGEDVQFSLTGVAQLWSGTMTNVLLSMQQSYLIAFVLIGVLMILFLGDWKIGLMAMIPNLVPILFTLGLMGYTGLPLDLFTILIGSIGIGLVVDDTVHFLSVFQRYLSRCGNPAQAIRETMLTTGRALLFTTLVLISGFASYTAAEFVNIFAFGMLLVVCISTALLMDLLVAPALLMLLYRRTPQEHIPGFQPDKTVANLN